MQKQNTKPNVSRRHFLSVAGGFTIVIAGTAIIPRPEEGTIHESNGEPITAWVHIRPDNRITIYNPAAEMGQGSMTALAAIIAEELDASWEDVSIEYAPIEPDTYGLSWRGGLGGPMITVGSRTVMGYYEHLRIAGAQARYVLLYNAAVKWNLAIDELITEPGLVKHETSGRSMSFGEIATFAKAPDHLPEITLAELKSPDQFRLIGKEMPRYDIPSKVDGSAIYSMDVQIPDMVYGVVTRSPVHGSKPTLLNEEEIRELEGVVDLMVFDHGIGVVTKKFGQAIKAKRQLQIRWSKDAQASDYNSLEAYSLYQEISNNKDTSWHQIESEGSLGSLLSDASDVFDASYQNDYVYHAQMEPLNAVVSPSGDGQSAEAWVGSQAQASARTAVADALGIKTENVKLHPCYLGGGFGRRSMSDYVTEAAKLAGQVKKPVKLIWTREDDLQYGAFRPICLQKMQAKVDSKGVIEAWSHRIIGTGGGLLASGARVPYYTMEAKRIEVHSVEHGVRTKHWRSVGHGPNKFAIEAFLDEIAHQKGLDPYVWRRDLMKNDLRSLAVLDTVAEMSNWNSVLDQDRARGIAFVERSGALAAGVAEISVNQETGMIKVHRFWSAVDAGIVVQPNNAIAQMEGGIVFGISSVLHESITFKNGKVQQSNFHDYPLSRMADTPELIEVKLIQSTEKPSGIGEASTPLVGGAIANAFLALTGKAIRHMPFTSGRVLELLS